MDKEKTFQLRKKVNELFFKKSYQNERLSVEKGFHGILL